MEAKKSGYVDFLAKSGRKMHSIDRGRPEGTGQPRYQAPSTSQRSAFSGLQPAVNPVLLSSVAVPLILLITATNAVIIYVTLRNRRLRNLRNMPRTSLAVADLIVGLLVGPMLVASYFTAPNRAFCTSYLFLETFCYTSSLINMLIVAIERSVTVLKPLHYSRYLTPCLVWGMIACGWALSMFIPISLPEYRSKCKRCYCVHFPRREKTAHYMVLGVGFVVFATIMIVMQMKVYLVVKSHRRRIGILPSNFGQSVGEATTTPGGPEASVAIQLNCVPVAQKDTERNSCTGVKIMTKAQALLRTQNDGQEPAALTRCIIPEQCAERQDATNQYSPRGQPRSQNVHLASNTARGSGIDNDVDSSRSQISKIYSSSGGGVLGVQMEANRLPSRSRTSTSIFKHTQFASFMYLAFILMWTPYLAILMMKNHEYSTKRYLAMAVSTKLLVIFNSLVNPFVHTIRMKEFRKCAKAYFCKERHD